MINIYTPEEIKILRESGRRLATVLYKVRDMIAPGISTKELDVYAEKLIRDMGDTPAFLGYRPEGARTPFPATLCVSVNDEVVHGIPRKNRILKEGDTVSIDLGIKHRGLITDMALSAPVGKIEKKYDELLKTTERALHCGIDVAVAGNKVGDIGYAIQKFVDRRYGIVEVLAGHGVGHKVHEDPFVPNFGKPGTGEKLKPGMVLAIEPMLNMGTKEVTLDDDDYTFRTADNKHSAHFEYTILITESDPEILTQI